MTALGKGRRSRGRKYFYNIFDHHASLVDVYDVSEHIDDPHIFLESALRHLKSGGYLVVNVPAQQGLYSAYDRDAAHIWWYNKQTLPGLPVETLAMRTGNYRFLQYWLY